MSQFINTKEALVTEAIDGLLQSSGGALARLDGFPHIKVVVRTDWDKSKVALVTGGGSGHEPAHAGFVGKGLVTAAVCGEIYASPSVDAVLAGILAVTGDAGCLLILKNYTGDRLNFGLAAERARALGLKVSMVIVGEDIALPDLPQPRGLAGTLFVHKVAGAVAEAGGDLDAVTKAATDTIAKAATIGMSLSTCTVPGSKRDDRIKDGMAELGLGIHGEAGVQQVQFEGARSAMDMVLDKLAPHMGTGNYVALLNNLGGTTPIEMSVLAHALANSDKAANINHLVAGPLMTALDMQGFSVSILPVDDTNEAHLRAPVGVPAWTGMTDIVSAPVVALPEGLSPAAPAPSSNADTHALITKCCDLLIAAEDDLNALDLKSGDGDTGSTLTGAARGMQDALDQMPLADTTALLRAMGTDLGQKMGGSSGVILAIFFSAAGDASDNGAPVADALLAGLARISEVGGASVGDRTMIDALSPALHALTEGPAAAAKAARTGANSTAKIGVAKAGRATYVPEDNLLGHNDPGAEAVARLFEGLV